MKTDMSNIEDLITNVTKQIKVEVEHLMEETVDKARALINTDEDLKSKSNAKAVSYTHLDVYKRQG